MVVTPSLKKTLVIFFRLESAFWKVILNFTDWTDRYSLDRERTKVGSYVWWGCGEGERLTASCQSALLITA